MKESKTRKIQCLVEAFKASTADRTKGVAREPDENKASLAHHAKRYGLSADDVADLFLDGKTFDQIKELGQNIHKRLGVRTFSNDELMDVGDSLRRRLKDHKYKNWEESHVQRSIAHNVFKKKR